MFKGVRNLQNYINKTAQIKVVWKGDSRWSECILEKCIIMLEICLFLMQDMVETGRGNDLKN